MSSKVTARSRKASSLANASPKSTPGALTGFRPGFAPGRPASFVAWSLPDGPESEPQLDSVWLDGEEVPRP